MTNKEEFVPNEQLRHERSLKGWSQAELAGQVGTSFEIVSRWERGITVPSPYYRERLCAALGKSAEELGFLHPRADIFNPLPSPLVFLASSHKDAEKPIISHLKTTLQEQGMALWSSRQLGRQQNGHGRITLREAVQAAQIIVVILSPEAGSSRHIREAMDMASRYERPVCGIWIEGEHLERCLPEGHIELAALIDAREKDTPALLEETAKALEQVRLASQNGTDVAQSSIPDTPTETISPVNQTTEFVASQSRIVEVSSTPPRLLEPTKAARPIPTNRIGLSRIRASILIGLAILVIAGGILGSLSLLTHVARSSSTVPSVARGGTWIDEPVGDAASLIPDGPLTVAGWQIEQALYLPLFYGDPQGAYHPAAATEVPTVQNGGIRADAKTWTFHLRPHLVWSDGQPYDARDVDYTWRLWLNPSYNPGLLIGSIGLQLISSADVSPDHLSITFHLKRSYVPFLQYWVDGGQSPLPAHHFSAMAPSQILKSPDNLNPQVVSGPFILAESQPGDHYTVVRNPRYYLAREGLPYLDKVMFRVATNEDAVLMDLHAGTVDSSSFLDVGQMSAFQPLRGYTLTTPSTSDNVEGLFFNFHNTVLANHLEVRQAVALAIDHQALIQAIPQGLATPLCTDHGTFYHPGYQPDAPCPIFNVKAANKLLSDNGWVKGPDGVRGKGNERLEFEFSTSLFQPWRVTDQANIQRDLQAIGIKLDIQNYPDPTFTNSFLTEGKASPPTGAVAGKYDIAEFEVYFGYDPDDSIFLACDQLPPKGQNFDFYCNPTLDALYRQELTIADPGVRQQIFVQIHQIYLTQYPFITLYSPADLYIVRKGTHNFLPSPVAGEDINIWEWWCDNGKC
jgi:peptide/nickel transport system substrate-binding protein